MNSGLELLFNDDHIAVRAQLVAVVTIFEGENLATRLYPARQFDRYSWRLPSTSLGRGQRYVH